ncbi:dnaJ homolog subfamily C member 9 [Patella vulgata]|uniref:dnaJ homolog subfamily C member 9 n=1 Tax=Patella vulgata TaxID=6465 RepID=UPI0024A85A8E|nr:dnaJ homolog subfamily C member 9 [Patella vulgata]
MSSLLENCRNYFDTDNLYKILKVEKTATEKELKKGYHRQSLAVHPDRVGKDKKDEATQKFQTLGRVYNLLQDKTRREIYDETGDIDEENDVTQDRDWYDYWRLLFHQITMTDIKNYKEKYQGSEEELKDLKEAYIDAEGDMDVIIDSVLCATVDDEQRFRDILADLIKKKEIPKFKAFTNEKKSKKNARKQKADEEAKEAEAHAKKLGISDEHSLTALIRKRQDSRQAASNDFFAQLEAKYAEPAKKKSKGDGKKKKK